MKENFSSRHIYYDPTHVYQDVFELGPGNIPDTAGKFEACRHKINSEKTYLNMERCKQCFWFHIPTLCKDCRRLKKKQQGVSNLRFSKPRPWSWTSRTFIILLTILLAPLITDVLRHKFSKKYFLDDDGGKIELPPKYTISMANACNPPGTGGPSRPKFLKTPLVYGQKVPNVSERTIGASGPAEGRIYRSDKNFNNKLKLNWDINVIFKNDENDQEDRLMTVRCKESLSRLAIMVASEWEGVKVRVTEAWKEAQEIVEDDETILHYEGRALDITTNDRDRSKYGLLARFAVSAGFDWVYYKSNNFIHCSCKSDSLDEALYEGCFSGKSLVSTPNGGTKSMSELKVGDEVLSVDKHGLLVLDTILTFMDRKSSAFESHDKNAYRGDYYKITTDDGHVIKMTGNHLIFVSTKTPDNTSCTTHGPRNDRTSGPKLRNSKAIFAKRVKPGQYVYIASSENDEGAVKHSKVVSVTTEPGNNGAYAPLTSQGTLLVDGIVTSCYAVIENHDIAHSVMAPARYYYVINNWITQFFKSNKSLELGGCKNCFLNERDKNMDYGVTWYPKLWFKLGSYILPSTIFQGH